MGRASGLLAGLCLAVWALASPAWADFSACESATATPDKTEQIRLYSLCLNKGGLVPEDRTGAYNNRGVDYMATGDLDKAIADFDAAIQNDPLWGSSYLNRGRIYLGRGDLAAAEADFSKAAVLSPSRVRPQGFLYRGQARLLRGDYPDAIADFDAAIRRDPKLADAYNAEARLLAMCPDAACRNGPKAVELALKLVGLKDDWLSHDTLAAAYAEAGRFEDAVREQSRAIEMAGAAGVAADRVGLATRLAAYQKGSPYHAKPASGAAAGG